MRILAIADVEAKALWDHFDRRRLEGVDMILSCGDLDPQYLSFLATFTAAPVFGSFSAVTTASPPTVIRSRTLTTVAFA